ncbi:growth arrest-specific protein 7-like isoform X2 [Rhopilema esculentum]|uniref:growth arrest-specific protein 7-like isoform X2 n=1 Tax=Rhopilema esculentum TaxID=499914 RepID=UPI0031DC1636
MNDIVTTIYAYTGEHGLNFEAGEKLNVLERGENGWWRGALLKDGGDSTDGSLEGWFPSSYVENTGDLKLSDSSVTSSPVISDAALPPNWKTTIAADGRAYYYNEVTQETTWSLPMSPTKSPPATFPKRHTISQCSSIKKPTSPTIKVESYSLSPSPDKKTEGRSATDSGYSSIGSPSLSSSRESIDARSVGSTGSGGNRRRRKTMAMNLTPSRPQFFNYPTIEESSEQTPLNQLDISFCDNFWDDLGESTGFDLVRSYIQKGKSNCKEMADFFRERAAIEDGYAKNLLRLAHGQHGNQEKGSCGEAWQKMKKGLEEEAQFHQELSLSLMQGLEKTLTEYAERPIFIEKKDVKRIDAIIHDDRKKVASRFKDLEKQRVALKERQAKINLLTKQQDISKAQKKIAASVDDLKRSIDDFNDAQRKWIDDTVLGLMELEKKESERIQFIQKKLEMYTELGKTAFDGDSQTMTNILESVKKIDPVIDRKAFVDGNRTGIIRPIDIKK